MLKCLVGKKKKEVFRMIIIGLAVICLFVLVVCAIGIRRSDRYSDKFSWNAGGICVSAIVLAILLMAVPLTYAGNVVRIGELKAFQEVNTLNYAAAVEGTKAILSEKEFVGKIVDGSLEKTSVGGSISSRITEWRDAVNAYNFEVAAKQKTYGLWIYPGWMVMPAEVNELPFLTMK